MKLAIFFKKHQQKYQQKIEPSLVLVLQQGKSARHPAIHLKRDYSFHIEVPENTSTLHYNAN
jgi:hypothetical protein